MISLGLNNGYPWILVLYGLNILLSAVLVRKYKGYKYLTFPLAIMASGGGIWFALAKMFYYQPALAINLGKGIYPFEFKIHIDNLSAFFILLISLSYLCVTIYSLEYMRHYESKRQFKLFSLCINLFVLSMLLVVTAGQLFFFLIAWEIMALSSYFLVIYEPEKAEVQKAGRFYIIMTHIGTAFIIAAFALMSQYGHTADISGSIVKNIPAGIRGLVFVFLLIGFGTKGGLIPLHIWLPYAHPAAPSNVSALMSGVMLKMAVYGVVRFMFGMLGGDILWWGVLVLVVGLVSTILGVMYALTENDLKRLLAYSSIENLGIIFIALGLAMIAKAYQAPALAALCLAGALFHALNHSLFKGLLFMGAGAIYNATGTKNIEELGGLIKKMPYTAVLFLIGALAIASIPPLNGFAGEWIIYQSIFTAILGSGNLLKVLLILSAALLAMAGALAAYCFVKVFAISFLARPRAQQSANAVETHGGMLLGMGVFAWLCVLTGIFPAVLLRITDTVNIELLGQKISSAAFASRELLSVTPLMISSGSSPLIMLLIILCLTFGIYALVRLFSRGTKVRRYGTWDCGFQQLTSRMQYTATGFSKPVRIVFRWLYRPKRELVLKENSAKYSIRGAKYRISTRSIFEDFLYNPLMKNTFQLFRRLRFMIQTGSIHQYLVYILVMVILMLVYFTWA
jgi:hydrogenase-4 component B